MSDKWMSTEPAYRDAVARAARAEGRARDLEIERNMLRSSLAEVLARAEQLADTLRLRTAALNRVVAQHADREDT